MPAAPLPVSRMTQVRWSVLVPLVLSALTIVVYANAFAGVFVFDDAGSLLTNTSLRHWATVWHPPAGETVGGRPILNLSFALNHALHGTDPWGYHAVNLLIHLAAGLLLYGLVRRLLARWGASRGSVATSPDLVAALVAGLFLLHPLQTESVTYLVQRAESLVSCWYLLTLYALVRGATQPSGRGSGWYLVSVGACLLGMGTKEVMVTAPLVALLLDSTLLSGSLREVWRRRWGYYLALAATWVLLAVLVLGLGRGTTAGFEVGDGRGVTAGFAVGLTPWTYLLTQAEAIPHYLRLIVWPDPLILDYGVAFETSWLRALVPGLVLGVLFLLAVRGAWSRSAGWVVVLSCFLVLAPSSSVMPVATQTMAEHRVYLVVAGVLVLVVTPLVSRWGRPAVWACLVWGLVLGWRTVQRNRDYHAERTIWAQTVAERPANARARLGLAKALQEAGEREAARPHLEEALRLAPDDARAHNEMGRELVREGRAAEALRHFATAVDLYPTLYEARYNHGATLIAVGQLEAGVAALRELAQRQPTFPGVHAALGRILLGVGRYPEAIAALHEAVAQTPDSSHLEGALGSLLLLTDQPARAAKHLEHAHRRVPEELSYSTELAKAWGRLGRFDDAAALYRQVLERVPGHPEATAGLAALRGAGP